MLCNVPPMKCEKRQCSSCSFKPRCASDCSTEPASAKFLQPHPKSRPVASGPSGLSDSQPPVQAPVNSGAGSQATPGSPTKAQKCFICVTGMTCASCVANVERNLHKHRGDAGSAVAMRCAFLCTRAMFRFDFQGSSRCWCHSWPERRR